MSEQFVGAGVLSIPEQRTVQSKPELGSMWAHGRMYAQIYAKASGQKAASGKRRMPFLYILNIRSRGWACRNGV